MKYISRRELLKTTGASAIIGTSGCVASNKEKNQNDLQEVYTILPAGTLYYPWGKNAIEQGFFRANEISLSLDFKPFQAQAQALSSDVMDVGLVSLLPHINHFNKGEDFTIIGWAGGLQGINGLFTRAESGYESIRDLKGKRIGVWSWGSSTVQSFRGLIAESTNLDLQNDFKTTTAAAPALKGLLDDKEVAGIIQQSGLTVSMASQPEKYYLVSQLNDYWMDKTGFTLPLTCWFTSTDWYENNPEVAESLVKSANAATEHWRNNTKDILKKYGEPANIETEEEYSLLADWTSEGLVFAGEKGQEYIDSIWTYLQIMKKYEYIKSVPNKNEILTNSNKS